MAEALGWNDFDAFSARNWTVRTRGNRTTPGGNLFDASAPSWTLTEKARSWTHNRPAPTLVTSRRSDQGIIVGRQLPAGEERDPRHGGWTLVNNRPAPTVTGGGTIDKDSPEPFAGRALRDAIGVRITLEEALVLQSFPRDYPVQGVRSRQFLQVGNAIPPLLANAILGELLR